jgi:hypothetical protein
MTGLLGAGLVTAALWGGAGVLIGATFTVALLRLGSAIVWAKIENYTRRSK